MKSLTEQLRESGIERMRAGRRQRKWMRKVRKWNRDGVPFLQRFIHEVCAGKDN